MRSTQSRDAPGPRQRLKPLDPSRKGFSALKHNRLLPLFALAACAAPPDEPPPPIHGTCNHFQSALQQRENVPNCEFRSQHTLINGLQPAYPGNKS